MIDIIEPSFRFLVIFTVYGHGVERVTPVALEPSTPPAAPNPAAFLTIPGSRIIRAFTCS